MLTPKQQLYALEFLVDLNPRLSALRAGYSEKSTPHRLPHVQREIDRLFRLRMQRVAMQAEDVVKQLASNMKAAAKNGDFSASNAAAKTLLAHLTRGEGPAKKEDPLNNTVFGSPAPKPEPPKQPAEQTVELRIA